MKVFIVVIAFLFSAANTFAQLNTKSDDYAATFRSSKDGKTQCWFTSARATKSGRSRSLYISDCSSGSFGEPIKADSPFSVIKNDNTIVLEGTPSFAACDPGVGVFGSNRLVDGKYYGNDLYEMRLVDGVWSVRRLTELCSPEWDDSPALSPDGKRIYFASDRKNPGTRKADLFMSKLDNSGHWSEPVALDQINSIAYSEETPFISEDHFLYYSTNISGDFDIWRVRIDDAGLPIGKAEPLAFDAINFKGSDEIHPCVSPGGSFFLYSTNKGVYDQKKDFDIVWVKLTGNPARLELDVRKRRRQTTERVAAPVHLVTGDRDVTIRSSAKQPLLLLPSDFLTTPDNPAADTKYFTTIIKAESDSAKYISAIDTIVGERNCTAFAPHTLFIWDTATYFQSGCIDTFPIKKVQYFVTGYWCPTTKKYAKYVDCPSLFVDSSCLKGICPPGELYSFKVETIRQHSECIDYKEFDNRGPEFADQVDNAIEQHLKAMESAFGSACIKSAIAKRKPIEVVVEGFTDPRGYGADCHYFGLDIDFTKSVVQVPENEKDHFRHNVAMKKYGFGGNQLLSELRAYNLATLLDNVWSENIEQYRLLKKEGLLHITAIGRAIDQHDISFEHRRSAEVRISAISDEPVARSTTPPPGEKVVICNDCQ